MNSTQWLATIHDTKNTKYSNGNLLTEAEKIIKDQVAALAQARLAVMNSEGMAECMDMLRADLIEAGVISKDVPPMMMTEAIMNALREAKK